MQNLKISYDNVHSIFPLESLLIQPIKLKTYKEIPTLKSEIDTLNAKYWKQKLGANY